MISSTAEQLCRRFSLAEIHSATGVFSNAHVIGKGGFGIVYKGFIVNGSLTVAIKRRLASNLSQGQREFASEIETLTKFRHHNLVSLIGFCDEEGEMILVYDYMSNGTLADHLHKNSNGGSTLPWNERLKICIGAGRGLDYLNSGCSIIHRDVKPTNILLDDCFTAKVSDFGLAKHLSQNILQTHVITNVKGSFGYFDPSYFTTGRLTRASDTYSFGVVLLEVLSGRRAVEEKLAEDELCMSMWAQEKIRNGKADQIVASNLKGDITQDCLKTFIGVVKRCLHHEPKKRLPMSRVVAQLELALEQQERRGTTAQKSQFWLCWNRFIPFGKGSTQKDQYVVEVDEVPLAISTVDEDDKQAVSTVVGDDKQSVTTVDDVLEDKQEPINEEDVNTLPRSVTTADILGMTANFLRKPCSSPWFHGGSVFCGVVETGEKVAVKRLQKKLPNSEFLAQVTTLFRLKHENVVDLLACSAHKDLQVLVYEFAPKGSLHNLLHGLKILEFHPDTCLAWSETIKIGVGIARGLCYIHEKGLIHRNIKSSNVLLFDDGNAKITDLHLSTQCSCKRDGLRPHGLVSNSDYHPPECNQTEKSDVYSFGVLLLELLSGSDVFRQRPRARKEHHVLKAKLQLGSENIQKIVDVRLKDAEHLREAVEKMVAVAASCVRIEADRRPSMRAVLEALVSGISRENKREKMLWSQKQPLTTM